MFTVTFATAVTVVPWYGFSHGFTAAAWVWFVLLLGANGIMDEYPVMRHLCNLETVKTYEGTDHIHALVIGERVTGVAAYK